MFLLFDSFHTFILRPISVTIFGLLRSEAIMIPWEDVDGSLFDFISIKEAG